jgi:hypothetical protein
MKIGLLLPRDTDSVKEWRFEQRLAGLRVRFGSDANIDLLAVEASSANTVHRSDLPVTLVGRREFSNYDVIACLWEDTERDDLPSGSYRVSSIGRVLPLPGVPLDDVEYPHLNTHPFNTFGPRGHGDTDFSCFQYFPFGHTFRIVGLGPIDAFGHRIVGDFRSFRDRDASHKLIVCFGGSAVWGTTVLPAQCFPVRLEQMLRSSTLAKEQGLTFSVLNFGIPGAVQLNELQRFLLFAADLRPDITIIHNGVNDFFYSATSSPWLIHNHAITYQQNFELWAQALHQGQTDETRTNLGGPVARPSDIAPIDVMKAFLRRKREFITTAKAFGSQVISGLQPFSRSKASISNLERERIRTWVGSPPNYQAEFALVEGLYRTYTRASPQLGSDRELNFHEMFQTLGSDQTHFSDMVHLDVEGEAVIASHYADAALSLLGGR